MKTKLSNEELSTLCWELSQLFKAGEHTEDALRLLARESDASSAALLESMAKQVEAIQSDKNAPMAEKEAPLAASMEAAGCFPAYVSGLVRVGEKSRKDVDVLEALSEYYENQARMDRRVRSALLYPAVMLAVMLIVIGVLLVRVLPIFDDVYASLGGRLTGVAGGLLALGRWLDKAMPVLWVLMVLVVVFLVLFAAAPGFRHKLTGMWRSSHGDKGVSRKINNAQMVQAISTAITGSLSPEKALEMAASLMAEVPAAKARCEECLQRWSQDKSMSQAMLDSGLISSRQCRMLAVGEHTRKDADTLPRIARELHDESESALEHTVSRVEPALVLICSLLVGLILLSVMLPLMHIMSAIG